MRLALQPLENGDTCVIVETAGGRSSGCGDPERQRAQEGIRVHPVLQGSMVYLHGSVGPEVETLTLRYQDGHGEQLPVVERFVLHDIGPDRFQDGKRPILLVARDGDGAEVARQRVGQRAFGPDTSIWSETEVSP